MDFYSKEGDLILGKLIRIITSDGTVLATAVDSTDIVSCAEKFHKSSATVTAAAGRLLTAASLMGAMQKQDDATVTLRVSGGGPTGSLIAVGDAFGNARVSITNPIVELPLNSNGKLDVGGAVGTDGLLSVIRDYGHGEPQTGHCKLVSGEIGEDITEYFASSEQIATICALGVLVNPDLSVKSAGGILIQLLPGAFDDTIEQLEKNLKTLPSVSEMIKEGVTPLEMLEKALTGFSLEIIDESDAEYRCDCSQERVERALISLGEVELEKLALEQPTTEVTCHFCNNAYSFDSKDLEKLISKKC